MGVNKDDIYRCGKKVFSSKGFKDTKVSDITRMAGISVGSFYSFYSSKEDLFMEIYTEENNKLKQHIFQTFGDEEDPTKALQKAMTLNNEEMQAHPILREWYNTDVFIKIERCYREKNEKNDAACLHDFSYEFVKKWQA